MIPSDPGIKCRYGFSAFSRFFGWRFEPFLLFRYSYTTAAGIMQGEPGQRRTAVRLVHRSARIFRWPFSCRFEVVFLTLRHDRYVVRVQCLCRAKTILGSRYPPPLISSAARTFFTVPSSFTARPFSAARPSFAAEFSFGFPWGMWKRGLGLWIRELLSSEAEQGFRRGIAGLWEEWGVFCGKKEKYAENILLFCTFYWYQ